MYVPGTDALVRVFRITDKDRAAIRRAKQTARGLVVGTATSAAFIESPSRATLVTASVAAATVAVEKRRRVDRYEKSGYAEAGSSEEAHQVALETPVPDSQES